MVGITKMRMAMMFVGNGQKLLRDGMFLMRQEELSKAGLGQEMTGIISIKTTMPCWLDSGLL